MRSFIRKVSAVIFFISIAAYSQKVKYDDSWGPQGFSMSKSATTGTEVVFSVREFSLTEDNIDGEEVRTLQFPGVFLPNDEGAPNLPGSSRYIAIPQGAKAEYVIKDYRTEVYKDVNISPAPNIPLDNDNAPVVYKKNEAIYSKNEFYPSSPVVLSSPSKIRGLDVVLLGITPFQYNPVSKELIVYRDIRVDVTYSGGNGHFGDDRLRNEYWDRIINNTVINGSVLEDIDYSARTSSSKGTDYEYIIICPDDATYISYANQLKEFRTKQGIRTGVVTITEVGGNTFAAIEAYINNAYNNWTIPPAAVLLMADWGSEGSAGTIYAAEYSDTYYPMVTDNFYADVDTSDGKALPEIVISRMTAQNEEHLQTMVSKIINYETSPPTSSSFYNTPITALGWQTERWFQICSEAIGGYLKNELGKSPVRINEVYEGNPSVDPWSTALNTSQVVDYFGPSGRGYIPSSPTTLGSWTGGDATDIANALNNGAFMLTHRDHGIYYGWGEPAFQTTNISSLTNTDLSFIFSMNCQTGMFDNSVEVFAERFHRYTYNGQNAGALGVIAATENSYSFVNDSFAWGIFDYIYPNFMPDYGSSPTSNDEFMPAFAMVSGKYFLDYSSWPYNTENKIDTNYLFHMLGDPYQVVYSEVPQNLTINYQELFEGETVLYISADAGAKIALVSNGEILATGTGTGGMTGITIPPQLYQTEIILTVTKQNYFRYETTIEVGVPLTNIGGNYTVDKADVDYGYVTVGGSSLQQFTITNSHSTEYLLGDITTVSGYTVNYALKDAKNTLHYTIAPGASRTFDLVFEPTEIADYSGTLTITSSAAGHETEYLPVYGAGALPDISLPVNVSVTTEPETSTLKNFNIDNTGLAGLNYSLSQSYSGYQLLEDFHTNDFQSGLIYTNSGTRSWATATGGTWNSNTTCAKVSAATAQQGTDTGIMTSASFDGSPYAFATLEFDQTATLSNSSITVEYYDGSTWTSIYTSSSSVTDHQSIQLPSVSSAMQLRFSCSLRKQSGSSWSVDNIAVTGTLGYSWLTINSPVTGLVAGSGSESIEISCDAAGLSEGVYNADINITSDDPDEPSEVVPVIFTVTYSYNPPPSVPSNVVTSVSGADLVIDWDVSADATSYDIYSADDPYGTFTYVINVSTNQYTVPYTEAKKFYYVVAKNETK